MVDRIAGGMSNVDTLINKRSGETRAEFKKLKADITATKVSAISDIADAFDLSIDEFMEAVVDVTIEKYGAKAKGILEQREKEGGGKRKRRGRRRAA